MTKSKSNRIVVYESIIITNHIDVHRHHHPLDHRENEKR